jgi:uroporphyrinogen decarboxylase
MSILPPDPEFSQLQATLFNKKSTKIPLIELGIDPLIKSNILGYPCKTLKDDIVFMHLMGYDYIKLQPHILFKTSRTISKKIGKKYTGAAQSERAWISDASALITNWEQFDKYPWPQKIDIDYSDFEQVVHLLPEGMSVIGQYGDIFTLAWELMGFANFARAIYEQPELVTAIFDRISDIVLSMFNTLAKMDIVRALWYSDDIAFRSGLMVSPAIIKKYLFPRLKYIGELARDRQIPLIYHSDGCLWQIMEDIIQCGVDALHPLEPGSMDMGQFFDHYREQLCMCGGIELDTLVRGEEKDVIKLVESILEKFGTVGGYCAGSSNSIPEYVKVENYLAMVNTVRKYNNI